MKNYYWLFIDDCGDMIYNCVNYINILAIRIFEQYIFCLINIMFDIYFILDPPASSSACFLNVATAPPTGYQSIAKIHPDDPISTQKKFIKIDTKKTSFCETTHDNCFYINR